MYVDVHENSMLFAGDTVNHKFKVLPCTKVQGMARMLGHGAFGTVYAGVHIDTHAPVAIKAEAIETKVPQLIFEHRLLLEVQGHPGVPTVYWFGTHNDCNVLVMQCLGPQIMAVRADGFRPPMHIGIVRHVARCVLAALCTLHRAGFVHRDLKPENMLWESNPVAGSSPAGAGAGAGASGPPKLPKILVIDFGLAKRVGGHPSAFPHVRFRNDKHLTGTPRYAAINAHRGFELSRRDDIESFGYVMTFLALGSLPWQSLEDHPDGVATNFQDMSRQKAALFPEILCKDLPPAFAYTITYARSLSFDAMPDFDHLLAMWET